MNIIKNATVPGTAFLALSYCHLERTTKKLGSVFSGFCQLCSTPCKPLMGVHYHSSCCVPCHFILQCPMFKRVEGDKEIPEPFAEMAKFFTESRLLQQDVKLLIEGVSNQLVIATIIHPVGYITRVCTCTYRLL